jgi:hypothetical protein
MGTLVTEQMSMLYVEYWGTVTNLICFAYLIWKRRTEFRNMSGIEFEEISKN